MADDTVPTPLAAAMTTLEATPPNQPTPTTPATPAEPTLKTDSLLNDDGTPKAEEPKAVAPEKYADFTVPDGFKLDPVVLETVLPVFKELGLTQEAAQKLVDIQTAREANLIKAGKDAYEAMRSGWQAETKAEFGTKLTSDVIPEIGRALALLPPEVSAPFRQAMDVTGAGDNVGFVRAFYALAKLVNEGKPVVPGAPNVSKRPDGRPVSAAQAIYGDNSA